jgi:hypothetical protein
VVGELKRGDKVLSINLAVANGCWLEIGPNQWILFGYKDNIYLVVED